MRKRSQFVVGVACALLAGGFTTVAAQDTNYWSNQYGTRAQLLGGTVVGSTTDLSSTFYNPGASALQTAPSLILSTDAFEYSSIEMKNGAGQGIDLRSTRGRTAPSIFTVRLTMDWLGDNSVALSYLTRHDFDIRLEQRTVGDRDVLPRAPGDESYAGELVAERNGQETWYGLSWARPYRQNIGIGVTQYVAYRSQRSRTQTILQAATPDALDGASFVAVDAFTYYNVRILWKVGAFGRIGNLGIGLALTTPSINLFGSGSAYANVSWANITIDSTLTSTVSSRYAEDLSTEYRSPLSVAAGASYELGSTTLYATAEWFGNVGTYDVLGPVATPPQSTGTPIPVQLTHKLKSIANLGGGVSHTFSEDVQVYGAFTTDRSAFDNAVESQLAISNWDIYHATIGGAFTVRNFDFTLGVSRGWADQTFDPGVVDIGGDDGGLDQTRVAESHYRRWLFIVGFSYPL